MTDGILCSCIHKNKLYRQMIEGVIDVNVYRTYKSILTNLIKKAKVKYFNDFINKHKIDNKAKWNLINSQIRRAKFKFSVQSHINANMLKEFFTNLGTNATKNISIANEGVFATMQYVTSSLFFCSY